MVGHPPGNTVDAISGGKNAGKRAKKYQRAQHHPATRIRRAFS
jgi:hypothetical protein